MRHSQSGHILKGNDRIKMLSQTLTASNHMMSKSRVAQHMRQRNSNHSHEEKWRNRYDDYHFSPAVPHLMIIYSEDLFNG